MVYIGGRVTNQVESRYSPIEGECLPIADALHKGKYFMLGCNNLILVTDHKLLVGVFKQKPRRY